MKSDAVYTRALAALSAAVGARDGFYPREEVDPAKNAKKKRVAAWVFPARERGGIRSAKTGKCSTRLSETVASSTA